MASLSESADHMEYANAVHHLDTWSVEHRMTLSNITVRLTQTSRSFRSALDIVKVVMEEVEKTSVKGSDKMELLQAIILSSEFRRIPLPNAVWQSIDVMIESDLLKPTVEMIILASQGKLDINQSVTCCLTFLQKCFQKRTTPAAPPAAAQVSSGSAV